MEERIVEKDTSRKVILKRTADGVDAVEATDEPEETGAQTPAADEEVTFEFPEEELDEDLVGLSPSQLREELARREAEARHAREEYEKLLREGQERLAAKDWEEAEKFFLQALVYGDGGEAQRGLWTARTKDFTDADAIYRAEHAEELAEQEEARALLAEKLGGELAARREALRAEEAPLRERVEAAMAERREAFSANRGYYLVRFLAFLIAAAVFAVGAGVSAGFLLRTQSILPVVLLAVFGGLALAALGVVFFFARKLYLANRLCAENEKLSSTEEGARLEEVSEKLRCIAFVLGD